MKFAAAALTLPLFTACVSIELPGVVTDTAKVAKDTYHSVTAKRSAPPAAAARPAVATAVAVAVADPGSIANTYVGQDTQTAAEVKQGCVNEAVAKLFKANGKEVGYTVVENTISAVNNAVVAHCRVTSVPPATPPEKAPAGA